MTGLTESAMPGIEMEKVTNIEERLPGYVTTTEIDDFSEILPGSATKIAKNKVDGKIEEVFDTVDNLLETKDNLIKRENLLDSLFSLLDDLWNLRHMREREFAKFIVLIEAITKKGNLEISNEGQIKALVSTLQTLKRPKILETDIKDCRKIIANAGLDIYKPLTVVSKYKVTIQEE